ncbi:general amino acid permease AGP2, partial [Mucidula mucida]
PISESYHDIQSRHLQLIGIGGSIGTALFLQIGFVLPHGGPGSLLIAFIFWSTVVMALNNCLTEMVTWIPVSSPFVRFADRFVDEALGFCSGLNFYIFLAILVPFEITAFNLMLNFWTDKVPIAAVITFVLLCYLLLNIFAVRFYGESEYWLAIGKVILAIGLLFFTFITMLGGNPHHDRFDFRNWDSSKVEGTPFVEYYHTGSTGRFMGFLSCLIQASFTVCGPEYLSMTAGEAEHPRRNLPRTYKGIFIRLSTFFVLGALCVGILLPYTDPNLQLALSNPKPGAGSSPYVIAMQNLDISGLPHVVNVLIMLSVFSAGNSYVFCASRTLYGMALERKMPRFLTKCTGSGVPVYCVLLTIAISLLAFLGVSNDSSKVLGWFVSLVTASQVLNYAFIAFTYLRFYAALQTQGIDRGTLPYTGWLQPFCAYVNRVYVVSLSVSLKQIYSLIFTSIMPWIIGYTVFLPGNWDTTTFVFSYLVLFLMPVIFVIWKLLHKTKFKRVEDITLFEDERRVIDAYEEALIIPSRMPLKKIFNVFLG